MRLFYEIIGKFCGLLIRQLVEKTLPYAHLINELDKIPGIDKITAMQIIAEATTEMSRFENERKFCPKKAKIVCIGMKFTNQRLPC